jgi:hypothetical protein
LISTGLPMRGVTTQSPTLGIHPGQLHARLAAAQQPVRRIDRYAIAGAALVMLDDFGELRKGIAQSGMVAGRGDIGAPCLDVPKRGVDRVVIGRAAGTGKDIRQHACVDEPGKRHQDAARRVEASGREAQTGQRDHRVAAPIAEPGIAGDHRLPVRGVGQRPREDEQIGGEHQPQHPIGRFGEDRVGFDRALHYGAVPGAAAFERGRQIGCLDWLKTGRVAGPFAGSQRQHAVPDRQMRVTIGKTPFALDRQVEILAPIAARREGTAGAGDGQGEPAGNRHRQRSAMRCDLGIETGRPGLAMVIAAIGEKVHRQFDCGRIRIVLEPPHGVDRVGPWLHPDAMLDDAAAASEAPNWNCAVEVKAFQQQIARRRGHAAAPAIGEERILLAVERQDRIALGEHHDAAERRIDRRDQQAVVAPRQAQRDRAGSISAAPVAQPPFAPLGLGQFAAHGATEAHRCRSIERVGHQGKAA